MTGRGERKSARNECSDGDTYGHVAGMGASGSNVGLSGSMSGIALGQV